MKRMEEVENSKRKKMEEMDMSTIMRKMAEETELMMKTTEKVKATLARGWGGEENSAIQMKKLREAEDLATNKLQEEAELLKKQTKLDGWFRFFQSGQILKTENPSQKRSPAPVKVGQAELLDKVTIELLAEEKGSKLMQSTQTSNDTRKK
jgi:hypothetical protein